MKLLVLCLIVLLIAPVTIPAAAQELPSHLRVSGTPGTPLDFNVYRAQFESLAAYSRSAVTNVSAQNFTNAQSALARYNAVADQLKSLNGTSSDQTKALDAVKASRADLGQLVVKSQRFEALSQRQATLVVSSPYSDESTKNTLEMQRLVTDLGAINVDLDTRNHDIADVVTPYGIHLEKYNDNADLSRYLSDMSGRLANVTDLVFRNTTISTQIDTSVAQYDDTIRFAGVVRTDQGGVPDVPVIFFVDNQTVAFVRTNATGYYNGTYAVEDISAGTHVVTARFDPQGVPYKAARSGTFRLSVKQAPANNTLDITGGSLAFFNKISLFGTVTTPNGPVKNAPIVLYKNGDAQLITHTDDYGEYYVTYSMGLPEFLRSLVSPQAPGFYTLLEPGDRPLSSAQSATLTSPVFGTEMATMAGSVVGGYLIIVAIALLIATPPLYVRRRRKLSSREARPLSAPAVKPAVAPEVPTAEPVSAQEVAAVSEQERPSVEPLFSAEPLSVPTAELPVAFTAYDAERGSAPPVASGGAPIPASEVDLPDIFINVRCLFDAGRGEKAITSLYDAMISLLVYRRSLALTTSMTNWEKFAAIESSVTEARRPARVLTYVDELARYSGKPISKNMLDTAIEALTAIAALDESEREVER